MFAANTISTQSGLLKPFIVLDEGFVAPRGVCLYQDLLIVADTAQNKIFIFKKINDHYTLITKLGNKDNQRNECIASSLQYPSGIWTDGKKLIVADAWNHRVLIWQTFPAMDYQPADVVVGQPDFTENQPNVTGLLATPAANSLYWPYGVWSDGEQLWIADTGNRRVLYFSAIPTANFTAAEKVIGQNSLHEKEYDPANAIWPYSVKLSAAGELLIADTQYYRCLYWKDGTAAFTSPCDYIIGQPDMQSNGQNQYRMKPAAHTLNWCYDACFGDDQVYVADTGNSRILSFDAVTQNNPAAENLIGQQHFETNGEASLSMTITSDNSNNLYWPFSVSYHQQQLAVADTGKSRILIFKTTVEA